MPGPNEEIFLFTSQAALKRMVEDAWHDSATQTAERLISAIERRNSALQDAVSEGTVLTGNWNHIFTEDGREVERDCLLVISSQGAKVIAMTIMRDQKERDATLAEMKDVEEGLATNNVGDDPFEWGFEDADDLPAWAADQIVDRLEGRL